MFQGTLDHQNKSGLPVREVVGCLKDEELDQLETLLFLERGTYKRFDYLEKQKNELLSSCNPSDTDGNELKHADSLTRRRWKKSRQMWRKKICMWFYDVIDGFHLDREAVWVAMSFIDRYIEIKQLESTKFKLIALTSLFLAVKLIDPSKTIFAETMAALSNGSFRKENIFEMELDILQTLQWLIHPPTPVTAMYYFYPLFPKWNNFSEPLKDQIIQLSKYLIELSTCHYQFIGERPSTIAFSSILISFDSAKLSQTMPTEHSQFLQNVIKVSPINHISPEVMRVTSALVGIYRISAQWPGNILYNAPSSSNTEKASENAPISPTSVYQTKQNQTTGACKESGDNKYKSDAFIKPLEQWSNDEAGYISAETSGEE
mmetsp:Transcript_12607/g.25222  ORF Transcript_12607/g.25222 Transcript_12607/m.25222 type:complete len:375 (-) Transcript_12607:54-1178(-)